MISIKDLSIKYKDVEEPVFKDVSFKVEKGEIIALLGPSGCGKTTLLNFISNLFEEGKVESRGKIFWNKSESNSDKVKIRTVFQTPTLLPWRTTEKNIAFGLEAEKLDKKEVSKKVQEAIKLVGLEGKEKEYPSKLSVGMQQRINFARALVCNPDILLLDEPFSALDVHKKKKLQKDFLKIMKEENMTAIFVTHSIEEALEMGDKLYVFFDGKKIKKGFYKNKFKRLNKKELYLNAEEYLVRE